MRDALFENAWDSLEIVADAIVNILGFEALIILVAIGAVLGSIIGYGLTLRAKDFFIPKK